MTLKNIIILTLCCSSLIIGCKKKDELTNSNPKENNTEEETPISNAAPSINFYQHFEDETILKMQKVKVTQTGFAAFFMTNNFTGGYSGIQNTIDSSLTWNSTSKILIASLWHTNNLNGIYARGNYLGNTSSLTSFAGEGEGIKTISDYGWKIGAWYNIVNRAWYSDGKVHIATYIQDLSTEKWYHTSNILREYENGYIGNYNNSFIENWTGSDERMDGRFPRKVFFKDCWALNPSGNWMKPHTRDIIANDSEADFKRNGIYHNNYDASYDATEDAYYLAHGAGITPSAAFNGARTRFLPDQTNQGDAPLLGFLIVENVTATSFNNNVRISWDIPETSVPQFSSKVDILDSSNKIVATVADTIPEKRDVTFENLPAGNYTTQITIQDIFNRKLAPISKPFVKN